MSIQSKLSKMLEENAVFIEKKNTDVIDLFINNSFPKDKKTTWGTENLKIRKEDDGWSLVNYSTVIAYRPNGSGTVYFNKRKYSVTTSKIQNQIRSKAKQNDVRLKEMDEKEVYEKIDGTKPAPSKPKSKEEPHLFPKD